MIALSVSNVEAVTIINYSYLGRVLQGDANTDTKAIDYLVDPDPGFSVGANMLAKDDGSIEGLFAANFTVTETDGSPYDPGDSLTAQWTLAGVPEINEPIYYITKVDGFRDVWRFDTLYGDTKEDIGGGLFTYTSAPLPTDPPGGPYAQGISHVSVFAAGVVPEPCCLINLSLIGLLAIATGWRRNRTQA